MSSTHPQTPFMLYPHITIVTSFVRGQPSISHFSMSFSPPLSLAFLPLLLLPTSLLHSSSCLLCLPPSFLSLGFPSLAHPQQYSVSLWVWQLLHSCAQVRGSALFSLQIPSTQVCQYSFTYTASTYILSLDPLYLVSQCQSVGRWLVWDPPPGLGSRQMGSIPTALPPSRHIPRMKESCPYKFVICDSSLIITHSNHLKPK